MPTTYAHDYFGKLVYQKLPDEIKQMIRANGDLYRIGLHGPDVLFYYMLSKNPVSQFGVAMHRTPARAFFEEGTRRAREHNDGALLSYLLGFGCHYLLDSGCHPYIIRLARDEVISHTLLEKEFDRYLMLRTNRDPYTFHPSDCIVPKKRYARVIHRAIPEISASNILVSMVMMKGITNAMVCRKGSLKRPLIYAAGHLAGRSRAKRLSYYLMAEHPAPEAEVPVRRVKGLFDQALRDAPAAVTELYAAGRHGHRLSPLWNKTYNG